MRIVFCGVGALGSTAATLCRNLPATLAFADFDRVESKNLLSQAFVRQSVGRNKAEALRLQLHNFFGRESEAFPVRLERTNIAAVSEGCGLLVDTLDNAAGRRVVERVRHVGRAAAVRDVQDGHGAPLRRCTHGGSVCGLCSVPSGSRRSTAVGVTMAYASRRPSAASIAAIVVVSVLEKASSPLGWVCAISARSSRCRQIASQRARESGSATGLADASSHSTAPAASSSTQISLGCKVITTPSRAGDPRARLAE